MTADELVAPDSEEFFKNAKQSTLFADVQQASHIDHDVGIYSRDYCITTLGITPSEYDASVARGAIEHTERERRHQAEIGWLIGQVVGAEGEFPHA